MPSHLVYYYSIMYFILLYASLPKATLENYSFIIKYEGITLLSVLLKIYYSWIHEYIVSHIFHEFYVLLFWICKHLISGKYQLT